MVLPFILTMRYPIVSFASFRYVPWWSAIYAVISGVYICCYCIDWDGVALATSYIGTLRAIPAAIFGYLAILA